MTTAYGTRLRMARKNAKLTQQGLSKRTGIPQSTISTAERQGQGSAETSVYARACGVDSHWLATGEGDMIAARVLTNPGPSNFETLPTTKGVPVISWSSAGRTEEAQQEEGERLQCPVAHGPRTYCLRVRGDSMSNPDSRPSYQEGEVIFVDPDREPAPGDRVIVRVTGQEDAVFKQLLREDGRALLKALNPAWSPRYIELTDAATVVGVIIGKWVPE